MTNNKIKVAELFAGVGGFRVGLEKSSNRYDTIWANQWEPDRKAQHAYDCYVSHFGAIPTHVNNDIATEKHNVPYHDLLVGGFPCQDYSVAKTGAQGIEGKKGVLWWHIQDVLTERQPSFVVLENVDRLLKSPASQRGRDFAVILRCLHDLGYAVEWRIINAADYGHAQRRRRIYITAFKNSTGIYHEMAQAVKTKSRLQLHSRLYSNGFFSSIFPVQDNVNTKKFTKTQIDSSKYNDLTEISNNFSASFYNSGIMIDGHIISNEVVPVDTQPVTLGEIRHTEPVDERFFLNGSLEKWKFLKGSKKIPRVRPNGEPYFFSEGALCFPDHLDRPARTMLTSESSVNRSTHVIEDAATGRLRLLTPVECERLNGFADNWTNTGMPEKFRYFTMGNALVVPIVEKIGTRLLELI
ncbi:MAG: DNA (cytosine-5-)-methyltransferase [Oscillospiraceae bacterium]|nr:DNA (cytosine-5-)-methyltransferase [Oscillospiraceae bacterium]